MRISDWSSDVCSADLGIAKLFSRLAADMGSDRPSQIALAVARLATFLAPHDAEGWLITADMLAADDKPEASLEALSHIAPTDPYAAHTPTMRIGLLHQLDLSAEALGVAQAAVAKRSEERRVGEEGV